MLPINLPVASLLSASMALGLWAGDGALVAFSPPSRWFEQVSSELYKKHRERREAWGLALWPRNHVGGGE